MKTKEFINLLKKSLDSEVGMYIPMESPFRTVITLGELYELDKEWERTKEAGEYFDIVVDTNTPGFVSVYPKRYHELLVMPPNGKKIYPKDESLRVIFGFVQKLRAKLTEEEEKERFA